MSGKNTYIIYIIYTQYIHPVITIVGIPSIPAAITARHFQRYQGCSESDSIKSEDPSGLGGLCNGQD